MHAGRDRPKKRGDEGNFGQTKEAGAKELAIAMRANKDLPKADRTAAALDVFKKSQTMAYADDKDATMDFEKFKRIGAQTGLADTFKDCLTAEKDDCALGISQRRRYH